MNRFLPSRALAAGLLGLWGAILLLAGLTACSRSTDPTSAATVSQADSSNHPTTNDAHPGKHDHAHQVVDPVALNGPVFEGWPSPQLLLVISGLQQGYLEPCGCAGLENQKGGLARRYSFIEQLRRDRGWTVVPLDLGDQVRRYGREAEIKLRCSIESLTKMGYQAVTLGPNDLRLPVDNLVLAAADLTDDDGNSRLVTTNIGLFGLDAGIGARWRVIESSGLKIGVLAVMGDSFRATLQLQDVESIPAVEAIRQTLPQLEAAKCDLRVLLAQASMEESRSLSQQFPQFDIMATAGGADEPPRQPETTDSGAMLVEIGHKGMYVAAVGVYENEPRLRYQRVPLDARYPAAPEMHEMLVAFQEELRTLGFDGLGIRPVPHPRAVDNPAWGKFAGSAACGKCHTKAYAKWQSTGHARATETLTKLSPPRQFDPECVSCHVTGWNPQQYVPYISGYRSLEQTPELAANGCENCHGPGAAHVQAESVPRAQRDPTLQQQLRQQMRLTKATAEEQACRQCHDLDNSPSFQFPAYWSKIEHPWKN